MEVKEKEDAVANISFDVFLKEFKTCLHKFGLLK